MNMGRVVFGYHAGRAALDARGGATGEPAGLGDIRQSAYTHVGVPMNSRIWPRRLVDSGVKDSGVKVIRTMESAWNPGLNQTDLGQIILDYTDVQHPGPFLLTWLTNIWGPCHGFAWNLEHEITNAALYPITPADRRLAALWGFNLADPEQYVAFRCRQFATIIRLMKKLGAKRWAEFTVIAYSEYGLAARERYGCDWSVIADPSLKLGQEALPLIDYAHCAYFGGTDLTNEYVVWLRACVRPPVLHNIQLPTPWDNPKGYRRQVADRLPLLFEYPGDGFGSCDAKTAPGEPHIWNQPDRDVAQAITAGLKLCQDPGPIVLRTMTRKQIAASLRNA